VLEDVTLGAAPEGLGGDIGALNHGEIDKFGGATPLFHLFSGIEAVQLRHGDIEDDNVGPEVGRGLQQGTTVGDHAYNFKFRFEKALARFGYEDMIVGNDNPGAMTIFHWDTLDP
jgi:hypothetical protein